MNFATTFASRRALAQDVLDLELEAAGRTEPGDRRRIDRQRPRRGSSRAPSRDVEELGDLHLRIGGPLVPVLEDREATPVDMSE